MVTSYIQVLTSVVPGAEEFLDVNDDSAHRYMMFSASFNKECRKLAREHLGKNHVRIRISRPGSAVRHIQQEVSAIDHVDLFRLLTPGFSPRSTGSTAPRRRRLYTTFF